MQTVLALISVLAAGIAFSQVYLMRSTAHGELLYEVMRTQGEQDYRDDRARVYALARKPFERWTPDEYECVERVATRLDQVGFLVKYRYVTMRAFSTWHSQLALLYQIIEPLIAYRRTSEKMPSLYLHFEWLARKSFRARERRAWWDRRSWRRLQRQTATLSTMFELNDITSTRRGATTAHQPVSP